MAANSGKANIQIVKYLVEDIRYFADMVKEEVQKMMAEVEELNSSWNDTQYRNFENFMRTLTDDLLKDTAVLYDCADKVEDREIKGN